MVVYQLAATGSSANGWAFRMYSKQVFTNKQKAEKYMPEFRAKCCDKTYFECALDDDALAIRILELELI